MITIYNTITFTIGGILGYLLKTQIDHLLAIARIRENIRVTEFNKSASIFYASFVDVIVRLRRNTQTAEFHYTNIPTSADLIEHEKAKIIFEPYIVTGKLEGFNMAWDKYKNCKDNYTNEFISTMSTDISIEAAGEIGRTNRKQFSHYCLNHIYVLLEYAKPNT